MACLRWHWLTIWISGKVALGGLIDRLESSGFVERRPDAIDRRVKRVFLTKKGSGLIKRIRESVSKAEADILVGIDRKELHAMVSALRAMKRNLLEILGSDAPDEEEQFEIGKTSRRL
jgi:MarR family transcriptional regulator for hemolysin